MRGKSSRGERRSEKTFKDSRGSFKGEKKLLSSFLHFIEIKCLKKLKVSSSLNEFHIYKKNF
jgi:hypothetical protein